MYTSLIRDCIIAAGRRAGFSDRKSSIGLVSWLATGGRTRVVADLLAFV